MGLPWDQTPSNFFEQQYLCYALSDKSRLQDGNRVIMPASALDRLASLNIEYPMVFSVQDAWSNNRISHCGVLEFSSEEGIVLMPNWMISNLGTQEGQLVTLKSTSLPKGTFVKIQPHTTKFIQGLSNPKAILEAILKDFSCITTGDTIAISYQGESYKINILETKPSRAISLIETDCEVDFAQPLDYKEPPQPPPLQPKKSCCPRPPADNQDQEDENNTKSVFRAFAGSARRLDGQTSQIVSTAAASKDAPPVTSSTNSGDSGSLARAGNMVSTRKREHNNTEAIPPKKSQEAEPNSKLFKPPPPQPAKSCCPRPSQTDENNTKSSFRAFTGSARRLDGQTSQPVSTAAASKDAPVTSTNSGNSGSRPGNIVSTHQKENNMEAITPKKSQEAEPNSKPLIREYTRILTTFAKIWRGLIELVRRTIN